jgi:alpha-galactosidase
MLVVGLYGKGNVGFAGGCTDAEYRTHFALWCLLASPLMIGCDVRSMTPFVKGLLTTKGAIAVNQDPLGVQARRIGEPWLHGEMWAKPLDDGSVAVGLYNRTDNEDRLVPLAWESVGLHDRREAIVTDLWTGDEIGAFRGSYVATVPPHDCALVKVTPLT